MSARDVQLWKSGFCKRGHARTPENTFNRPCGRRECKPCTQQRIKAARARDPERFRKQARNRYAVNPKIKRNLTLARWRRLGINLTWEEHEALLQTQRSLCALCNKPLGETTPYPDHDHVTGKVRGLVHSKCNSVIGFADDDPILLRQAADYVERHRG